MKLMLVETNRRPPNSVHQNFEPQRRSHLPPPLRRHRRGLGKLFNYSLTLVPAVHDSIRY